MKKNVISTITKSLPIEFSSLVNYSLLVTLCYINLFLQKRLTKITQAKSTKQLLEFSSWYNAEALIYRAFSPNDS